MVNGLVQNINNGFIGIIQAEKYYDIAQTVVRVRGSEREALPGVVAPNGEIEYVGFDDAFSMIVYHKLNALTITRITNGRGDNIGDVQYGYQLSMYAYWDRKKLQMMPDELLMLLQARFPNKVLLHADIKSISLRISGMNPNTAQLIAQEYQNPAFTIEANKSFMQINYLADIIFNPACLPTCP